MAKRRKPTDSTLRNVRASRKADAALIADLKALRANVRVLETRVDRLESRLDAPFATEQRRLGYQHSTAPKHQLRVKER